MVLIPQKMSAASGSKIFGNFDEPAFYKTCATAVISVNTQNFVVEFNNNIARCALNVSPDNISELLSTGRSEETITRWINIWAPETQKDFVNAIAMYYGFSPRLLGLMHCEPLKPVPIPDTTYHSRIQELWHPNRNRKPGTDSDKVVEDQVSDLESHPEKVDSSPAQARYLDLNHYLIVNEVWHYASVDWGHKYLCIGYNSLFNTRASLKLDPSDSRRNKNRPAGKRVWTWLVLCNDGTVISINENVYPNNPGKLEDEDQHDLEIMRRNLKNVFDHLSTASGTSKSQNPLNTLPIRTPSTTKPGQYHASPSDAPSLVFYYLFDDWYTTYSLVARQQHQYGAQLEKLRLRMFTTAELRHVDELHHIGRQLAVLKRIYQSYDNIIERILDGPKQIDPLNTVQDENSSKLLIAGAPQKMEASTTSSASAPSSYGVPLATAATVRFERLKDRISLFALNEIQDCLDEKEALVQVNFNLIQMKESSAVEKLTRITILLAKVTILFMPVSLMTAYFSVQIADLAGVYTHMTYWISFAVVMSLSFIFLLVFGQLSGTQESKTIYRSLSKVVYDSFKDKSRSKMRKRV